MIIKQEKSLEWERRAWHLSREAGKGLIKNEILP